MSLITIQGQIASGGEEIGPEVARLLGADYVDRMILAEAGKRVGATVEALEAKEQQIPGLRARLSHLFQRALERSAYAGTGGDPFFGMGMDTLLTYPYPQVTQEPTTRAQEVDDEHFFQVINEVILELAGEGNAVILGRGANLILKDRSNALHVGVVAPMAFRIERFLQREKLDPEEAERQLTGQERARVTFFERHFKKHPDDSMIYHLMVNTSKLNVKAAAEVIVHGLSLVEQGK